MPPKSSATANVAKNIFRPMGTRLPNMESTPNENAMSVAMGMAVPRNIRASSGQVRKKISTGMAMPPQAPMMGSKAFFSVDSSPTRISLLISSPTEKKNKAMRKSLIKSIRLRLSLPWLNRLKLPIEKLTGFSHKER